MKRIFSYAPYIEVLVRNLFWRSLFFNRLPRFGKTGNKVQRSAPERSLAQLLAELEGLGIRPGQILIVHSSMRALSVTATPAEVVTSLVDFLGPSGTLVMPAIPRYPNAPTGPERLSKDLDGEVWTYDVQNTPPWTGALPYTMMCDPRSHRSSFPLNTVVTIGHEAEAMLAHELDHPRATACGPNSAWSYMARRGAEIVAIGVDLAHSLTMIHVAEDAYEENWPVQNWYRDRVFDVMNDGQTRRVAVRERHPKWACYYGEQRLNRDLERANLVRRAQIGSLTLKAVNARALLDFLNARKASAYPYFLWSFER